jgi:hypothetical protein
MLNAWDSLDNLDNVFIKQLVDHPVAFGVGVGVANGLIAKGRSKKLTGRATLLTALVLAAGEGILAMEDSVEERKGRTPLVVGALSGLGVLLGLALFTDWGAKKGARPVLVAQADKPAAPTATA